MLEFSLPKRKKKSYVRSENRSIYNFPEEMKLTYHCSVKDTGNSRQSEKKSKEQVWRKGTSLTYAKKQDSLN